MKTRRHSRKHKGAGYGFGGSILSDAGGAGAGNAKWDSSTGTDCGVIPGRAGNNLAGGKRRSRRRRHHKGGMVSNASLADRGGQNVSGGKRRKSRRKTRRGGAYVDFAQQAPRTGYGFNGQGVAGTSDTIPY